MPQIHNPVASQRKTVTLTTNRWAAVEEYRQKHGIRTVTETIDRLVAAGLQVKVAIVGRSAKRRAL
jgi:hypothetical protein